MTGFADANHPEIYKLREVVDPAHALPEDVIERPTIIVVYYLSFTKEMVLTNLGGEISSKQWARAYEETNALFGKLNIYLIEELGKMDYRAGVSPEANVFDKHMLKSKCSQRHIARIAGLGNFGLNNMLITRAGSCGRNKIKR